MWQGTYRASLIGLDSREGDMATRSYRSVAETAKAQWSAEAHDLSAGLGAELAEEVDAQVRLGRDLAAMRAAAALTQGQLAARASVQQAEISRIERGLGNPTRDTLIRLATAVGGRVALVPVGRSDVSRDPIEA